MFVGRPKKWPTALTKGSQRRPETLESSNPCATSGNTAPHPCGCTSGWVAHLCWHKPPKPWSWPQSHAQPRTPPQAWHSCDTYLLVIIIFGCGAMSGWQTCDAVSAVCSTTLLVLRSEMCASDHTLTCRHPQAYLNEFRGNETVELHIVTHSFMETVHDW